MDAARAAFLALIGFTDPSTLAVSKLSLVDRLREVNQLATVMYDRLTNPVPRGEVP